MNKFFKLVFIAVMLNLTLSTAHATTIEGSSDEVLQESTDLLKSVVHIEMGDSSNGWSCTASLIAKDVLLTAKHCVADPFAGFKINGFRIADPQIFSSTNTDVAILRFVSTPELDQNLRAAQFLKISLTPDQDLYTRQALLAGYGMDSANNTNSVGTLRAGKNYIVEGNSTIKWLYDNLIKANGNPFPDTIDKIHVMGVRETVYENMFVTGQNIEVADHVVSDFIPESQAIALSGDSGGPLIGFDQQNNPIIVGVTSTVSTQFFGSTITEVKLKDMMKGLEKTISLDTILEPNYKKTKDLFLNALISEGFVKAMPIEAGKDDKYIAIKPFSYVYKMNRFSVNSYSATAHELNQAFIKNTMKSLGY